MKENSEGTPNPLNPRSRSMSENSHSSVVEDRNSYDREPEVGYNDLQPKSMEMVGRAGRGSMRTGGGVSARVLNGQTARRASISRANRRPVVTEAMISESMVAVPATGTKSGASDDELMEAAAAVSERSVTPATEMTAASSNISPEEKKKKSKLWLILGIILLLCGIGCGIAAFLLKPDCKEDKVTAAVLRLMSGDTPRNVVLDGKVNLNTSDPYASASAITVDFDSSFDIKTFNQTANANVTATLADGQEFSFDASEVHLAEGDLFLKLDNIAGALQTYTPSYSTTTDCDGDEVDGCDEYVMRDGDDIMEINYCEDEYCEENIMPITNCIGAADMSANCLTTTDETVELPVLDSIGLFEVIEDEWIRIPGSDFSNVSDIVGGNIAEGSQVQCLIDTAGNLGSYQKGLANSYKENTFVTYTTDNLTITKKKHDLFRLGFNNEKLAAFINSMSNSGFMNELISCMGGMAVRGDVTADQVAAITAELPVIYVEIDDNYNFTRLYMTLASDTSDTTATLDMSISYPTELKIEEPANYIDISEVLTRVLSQFYGADITEGEE